MRVKQGEEQTRAVAHDAFSDLTPFNTRKVSQSFEQYEEIKGTLKIKRE